MKNNKEFYEKICVPASLCNVLRHNGFEEKCIGYWFEELCNNNEPKFILEEIDGSLYNRIIIPEYFYHLAPTWSQIFDWFEEKHGLKGWTSPLLGTGYHHYYIVDKTTPYVVLRSDNENDVEIMRINLLERLIKTLNIKNEALKMT